MTVIEPLRATFTISTAARQEIEKLRTDWNAQSDDPADVVMIGWGEIRPRNGAARECIVVSFYGSSQHEEIAPAIQQVSGLPVVFFTVPRHAPKFDGKVVDYQPKQGFYLRAN